MDGTRIIVLHLCSHMDWNKNYYVLHVCNFHISGDYDPLPNPFLQCRSLKRSLPEHPQTIIYLSDQPINKSCSQNETNHSTRLPDVTHGLASSANLSMRIKLSTNINKLS